MCMQSALLWLAFVVSSCLFINLTPDENVPPLSPRLFGPGSVTGKITRLDGTTAIAGASVNAYQGASVAGTATTNATGDYTIGSLTAGTYSVEATAAGYERQTQTGVIVVNDTATTINMSLPVPINYSYDDLGRLIGVVDKN